MKRLALILLMLGLIAGAAIPQMVPTFSGKLYNRAWYQSVPSTWASYLMQLNVGGVTMAQINADGSATFAGDITANGVVLGAGGAGSPGGADTQVQFNDATAFGGDAGMTYNKTTDTLTLAGNLTLSTAGATVDGVDVGAIPTTYAPIDSPTFTTGITTPAIKVTGGTPGAGKVLTSDDDGDASWAAAPATAPAGSDTQVQYNDNGSFGAANATWDAGRFEIGTTATGATLLVHSDRATPFTNYLISDVAAQIWPGLQFDLSAAAGVTPASGLGADIRMLMQTSTTASQPASRIETQWLDATHATRRAGLGLYVSEAHGEEVGLRVQGTSGTPNVIGGYSGNTVTAGKIGAFIGGGGYASNTNAVGGNYSSVIGGAKNTCNQVESSIVGGNTNSITGTGSWSSILGGANNTIQNNSTVLCAIVGGRFNSIGTASIQAVVATILGGWNNYIGANNCITGGYQTRTIRNGTFLWADSSVANTAFFPAEVANEFAIRATGGARFVMGTESKVVSPLPDPADDYIDIVDHGWENGDAVTYYTDNVSWPTPITNDGIYYIINKDPDKFQLALTPGGAAINITASGGGTHTVTRQSKVTRITAAGVIQPGGGYNSVDGTAGMSDTRAWTDADGNDHAVTIKNGLITAWTVTPP